MTLGSLTTISFMKILSKKKLRETEDNLVQSLKYFSNRREILFSYNFE
jgi:hypothetical protein